MTVNITNAAVGVLAAAVPAPYGPLTRVTDVEAFGSPNVDVKIEFTDTLGSKVYLTWAQLNDADAVQRQIAYAEGLQYRTHKLIADIQAIDALADATKNVSGGGYTPEEYDALVLAIRALDPIRLMA